MFSFENLPPIQAGRGFKQHSLFDAIQIYLSIDSRFRLFTAPQ